MAGLFCPSTEVTPKVINARRLRALSELSANALLQKTTEAACASVAATLAKNSDDIPFAVLYLIDDESEQAILAQSCGVPDGIDALTPASIELKTDAAQIVSPEFQRLPREMELVMFRLVQQFAGNVPTFFVLCLQQTTGEISELLRLLNHFSGPQAHLGIEAFRQFSIILLCLLQVGYVDAGWVKEHCRSA